MYYPFQFTSILIDQEEPYYCEIGFNFRKNPEQVFDDLYYISAKNNNHLFFLKKKKISLLVQKLVG